MRPKDKSVKIDEIHPAMEPVLRILDDTRQQALRWCLDTDSVVTAGKEPGHSARSYHHDGLAVDVRISDFAERWAFLLSAELGKKFDVVVEPLSRVTCRKCGEVNPVASPHLHIERDTRRVALDPM